MIRISDADPRSKPFSILKNLSIFWGFYIINFGLFLITMTVLSANFCALDPRPCMWPCHMHIMTDQPTNQPTVQPTDQPTDQPNSTCVSGRGVVFTTNNRPTERLANRDATLPIILTQTWNMCVTQDPMATLHFLYLSDNNLTTLSQVQMLCISSIFFRPFSVLLSTIF